MLEIILKKETFCVQANPLSHLLKTSEIFLVSFYKAGGEGEEGRQVKQKGIVYVINPGEKKNPQFNCFANAAIPLRDLSRSVTAFVLLDRPPEIHVGCVVVNMAPSL